MMWILVPLLKIQIARITLFDLLALVMLGYFFLERFLPWLRPRSWVFSANPIFYLSFVGLLIASLASGLNALDAEFWGIELLTFVYILLMLLRSDVFCGQKADRMVVIGAWAFAAICLITGIAACLDLFFGFRILWFYDNPINSRSFKFSGLQRYPNQWSGYFVTMFPLLIALSVRKSPPWHKILLVACIAFGVMTIPASGSRSGIFLLLAETGGFFLLYLLLSRSQNLVSRVVYMAGFALLLLAGYVFLFDQLNEIGIARRSFLAFDLVESQSIADDWRSYNWNLALDMFADHPFAGIGLGTFELYGDKHEVHSSYLSFLAETGMFGFLAYVVAVFLPFVQLCRALLAQIARSKPDLMLIALIIAVVSQFAFAIHHNNTRHRHAWLILFIGMLYAEYALAKLRFELQQQNAEIYQQTQALLAHRRTPRPKSQTPAD